MDRKLLAVSAAALLAAGCASMKRDMGIGGSGAPTVDDVQSARLPQDQLQKVQQMRTQVDQADMQVARAEVALRDANNELNAAQAQAKVVDQQINAIEARMKAARESRDDQSLEQAQQDLRAAQKRDEVEQARIQSAKAQVELAQTRRDLQQKQLALARDQLQQEKYQALVRANDPAADKYKPADFQKAIEANEKAISEAQRTLNAKQAAYQSSYQSWQRLQRQLTAASRPPPG